MTNPSKKKRTNRSPLASDIELRLKHERFVLVFESVASLCGKALYCFTVVAFAFVTFYLPVTVAPGETTVVENVTRFLGDVKANIWAAWGVAGAAGLWAKRERNLRMDERAAREGRIRNLEKLIDPTVTSSRMDLAGTSVVES